MRQFSFGWKRHSCGSATGHLRFRCGQEREIALNKAHALHHRAEGLDFGFYSRNCETVTRYANCGPATHSKRRQEK